MCEEIRKNPELNEAELSSVSGGDARSEYYTCHEKALQLCHSCPLYKAKGCNKEQILVNYLMNGNYDSVHDSRGCPFYTK